jgi:hypothetical protein
MTSAVTDDGSLASDARPVTVGLADDHAVVRGGLRLLLQAEAGHQLNQTSRAELVQYRPRARLRRGRAGLSPVAAARSRHPA